MKPERTKGKAVFIDKDGTLVYDVPYNVNPDLVVLQDGVPGAMKALKDAGFLLVLISNQSGIARGLFTENDLEPVKAKIQEELLPVGVQLDAFYFCPHHPCGHVDQYNIVCSCRKPKPGMLLQAAAALNIDLRQSWMVGDILDDVEAGNRAGCRTILIDNGNENRWQKAAIRHPTFKAASFADAAEMILLIHLHNHLHERGSAKYYR